MSAFSREDRERFLWGEWVQCVSSNIREAMYDPEREVLSIGFGKPGTPTVYYEYPNVWPEFAETFALAESKGRWVHQYLKQTMWAYTKLL
jgi:hypothetical protein